MQNKINLGIVGKNFGYKVIYKSFLKNKKFKVIGFAFKKKNTKLTKKIKIYSSWKKMILDRKIDAIVVAVPPKLHKNIVGYAIKNKKHVFCEKPFTTSYKEASFLCNQVKKTKKIAFMVNYEFTKIDAFSFLKQNIINNIKINKVYLNWFINIEKKSRLSWKESHSQGGGMLFNYVCHAIYYLEFIFGKIKGIKSLMFSDTKDKLKILKLNVFFNSGLVAKLKIKVGKIKYEKPTHELKILSNRKTYILKTNLNSLSDKFSLVSINNSRKKERKILINNKKNKSDFRLLPTYENTKIFYNWISKNQIQKPNFFDACRIHLIIDKIILSSKTNKKIYID